jgi:protein gp37
MENSKIEWTHHTFNPWIGCAKVSPGCAHCYAETLMDTRYGRVKWGKGQPRSRTSAANWRKPRQWNKAAEGAKERPRVFCASLADWLDDEVPIQWLAELMDLIRETPNLDWLLLTKRPQNFDRLADAMIHAEQDTRYWLAEWSGGEAPHNVWVGTTVEDQQRVDERIPHLVGIPAVVRFLSCEPLLEEIDLSGVFGGPYVGLPGDVVVPYYNFGIDWVIVGGESGPGARPIKQEWVLKIRDLCDKAQVAFFFKQWGGLRPAENGRLLEGLIFDGIPSVNT